MNSLIGNLPSAPSGSSNLTSGWSAEATKALLSLLGERNIQSQLDGVVRNKLIYGMVAESMCEMGYIYTWKQCRTKVKNLTQAYRKVSIMYDV